MPSTGQMAHLDFEAPLVELEERIAALKALTEAGAPEAEAIDVEIGALEAQAERLQRELYEDRDVWKKVPWAIKRAEPPRTRPIETSAWRTRRDIERRSA
jgi:acetyl-CoA carboxylase alpha subunit